jgi:hypothetical protein
MLSVGKFEINSGFSVGKFEINSGFSVGKFEINSGFSVGKFKINRKYYRNINIALMHILRLIFILK